MRFLTARSASQAQEPLAAHAYDASAFLHPPMHKRQVRHGSDTDPPGCLRASCNAHRNRANNGANY